MSVRSLLTIADWDLMPEDGNRYEIIEGDLVMSCAPSILHQLVVQSFGKHLGI